MGSRRNLGGAALLLGHGGQGGAAGRGRRAGVAAGVAEARGGDGEAVVVVAGKTVEEGTGAAGGATLQA